ncbi:MAG: TetR/AcrR family transcriptional regulator [Spirochaetia bacterium]
MTLTERQREIIENAVEIIARQGIQELTIKNLSSSMHISEPALYRHFENKHAILVAILEYFAGWSVGALTEIADSEAPPEEQLREVFRRHISHFAESPATSGVLFAEEIFKNEPALARTVLQIMATAERTVRGILQKGINSGVFRSDVPLDNLVMSTLGPLRLLVTQWRLRGYDFDLRRRGEALADSVVTMVSA